MATARSSFVRNILCVLALALASPLAAPLTAQSPTCTSSKTTRLVSKGNQWMAGTLKSWYVSTDSVAQTCKGFPAAPATVDTVWVVDTVRIGTPVEPPKDTVVTPPSGRSTMYFNSAEPACSATALLCDDFEDGDWYTKDCDQANASGGLAQTDGWCGTIYGIRPPAKAKCGSVGVRSNCAASHGVMTGGDQGWMADHDLPRAVSDVYIRFYVKALAGYQFGAEKVLTVNQRGGSGIWFGNLHFRCGAGAASGSTTLQWQPTGSESGCRDVIAVTSGRWYYVELHLNTATGLFEAWADDCGPAGTTCPATPTLRFRYTGFRFQPGAVGNIWLENWANPASRGERLVDNLVVATTRIGF